MNAWKFSLTIAVLAACASALLAQQPGSVQLKFRDALQQPDDTTLHEPPDETGELMRAVPAVAIQDIADPAAPAAAAADGDEADEGLKDALEDETEESEQAPAEEEDEGPVRLFCPCHCGIQVGGWISGGKYDNSSGNDTGLGNYPVGFRYIADGATLDQAWIWAEKGVELDECGSLDWGFRIDFLFGTDANDTNAFGDQSSWDFRWTTSRDYGSAMPQLYLEAGLANWKVKAGHFYTIIGYEVVQAPSNFFYSHAYMMYYGEPFTHTGFLAEGHYCDDKLILYAGWSNGWDSYFGNYLDASTPILGVTWTLHENLTLTWASVFGDFGDGTARNGVPGNQGDIYYQSVVLNWGINECIQYVFLTDYGINTNLPGGDDTEWYGVNQNLFYTLSSCHKLGFRAEWWDDADGARTGFEGNYFSLTLGLNYTPNSNVILRPEIRYDAFDGEGEPFDQRHGVGHADDQFFYGMDLIVIY